MIRVALLFVMAFCTANAFADASSAAPSTSGNADDVRASCTFRRQLDLQMLELGGGGIPRVCRAEAQFDRNLHPDQDDFLRIRCGDGDNDADDVVIYNDGVVAQTLLDGPAGHPETNLLLEGRLGKRPPRILVLDIGDRVDWNKEFRAELSASIGGKEFHLRGTCTFKNGREAPATN